MTTLSVGSYDMPHRTNDEEMPRGFSETLSEGALWQTGGPGTKWNYAAMVSEHWNEPAPRSCDWNGDGLGWKHWEFLDRQPVLLYDGKLDKPRMSHNQHVLLTYLQT